ncbi:MAG TPA: SBBP repeat-containing protein [Pyrinomonadaceae bacterium]|jgi:uncharacterized repeat protein (TIGR01451 family)
MAAGLLVFMAFGLVAGLYPSHASSTAQTDEAGLIGSAEPVAEPVNAPARQRGARQGASPQAHKSDDDKRVKAAFAQLPIAFIANEGQLDDRVSFSARGGGYQLFLTQGAAVLSLSKPDAQKPPGDDSLQKDAPLETDDAAKTRAVLRISLPGANPKARVAGETRLEGKANYFIGSEPGQWRTDVSMFAKVRYQEVYPGVDLIYYGNQRQLEYDFVVAPHADPQRINLRFEGAREVYTDAEGNLVLRVEGGEVRQHKPIVYQLVAGERREVFGRYVVAPGRVGFELGAYDRSEPLIIDPVLSYASFLGGDGNDQALGVALDAAGNTYITGQTESSNFPGPSPLQSAKGAVTDAYVLKLNPSGTALVYATYLGGNGSDTGQAIAVDTAGNAYVTGLTGSGSFPRTFGTLQESSAGGIDGFVTKLNPAGNGLVYSSFLGGASFDQGYGIAVDAAGKAYVTGRTDSSTFLRGWPMPKQGSSFYKSNDAAGSWNASNNGLTDPNIAGLAVDPSDANIVYAAGTSGVFKSTDGGNFWRLTGQGRVSTSPLSANSVVVDPVAPSTLYASTIANGVYKSTNGGDLWDRSSVGLSGVSGFIFCLAIDPNNSATVYAGTLDGVYKSTNGGASWSRSSSGIAPNAIRINKIIFDPANSNILYAATNLGVYKSLNGATSWAAVNNGLASTVGATPSVSSLSMGQTTIYAGTTVGVFRSTDGGQNWLAVNDGLRVQVPNGGTFIPPISAVLVSPATTATVYAASTQGGVFKSTDGGANWTPSNNGLANIVVTGLAVNPLAPATLYASTNSGSDAFALKIDETGTFAEYLHYLGGNESDLGRGVAVDSSGNAYYTGVTSSFNFPLLNPAQASGGGVVPDAFVTKLSAGGSLVYSTYLGGTSSEQGLGIAVNAAGNAYVTGSTSSPNFPTAGPRQTTNPFGTDAFITKLSVSGSNFDYSVFHGGASTDQGNGIAVDASGNAYVTGTTSSTNFPVADSVQSTYGGGSDAFVVKLTPTSDIVYSTYLGGFAADQGTSIAVDQKGGAYVVGNTASLDFTTVSPLQAAYGGGGTDGFLARIGSAADLSVTVTASRDVVMVGGDLIYTAVVRNVGPSSATAVKLNNALTSNASVVSATATQGTCSGGSVNLTCALGDLSPQGAVTVTIVVRPNGAGVLTNTISVTADEFDPIASNNTATHAAQISTQPSIVGRVLGANGEGLSGVTVTLGGTQTATTTTDNRGYYQFAELAAGGTYQVTPTKVGYTFVPLTQTLNELKADAVANFSAEVCSYSLSQPNLSIGSAGGTGSVSVAANGDCPWSASSNAPWITITSGSSGNGNGVVSFSVAPTGAPRSGLLRIAGQQFVVWQESNSCGAFGFQQERSYPLSIRPTELVTSDFNNDGKLDLAALQTLQGQNSVAVLLGNGIGGFGTPAYFPAGGNNRALASGDFNGDGNVDLIATDLLYIQLLFGNGAGGFSAPNNFTVGTHFHYSTRVADFNRDGKLDLAVTYDGAFNRDVISILLGNGNGTFGAPLGVYAGAAASIADLNNDGKPDLLIVDGNDNLGVRLGDGAGNFAAATNTKLVGATTNLSVKDVNGDGNVDVVAAGGILLGNGAGGFAAAIPLLNLPPQTIYGIVSEDFNNDAKPDLLAATVTGISVLAGDGTGRFGAPVSFAGESGYSTVVADFNGDGRPDVAMVNYDSGAVKVVLNSCQATPGITISGRVTNAEGVGIYRAYLRLTSPKLGTIVTQADDNGNYAFRNLSSDDDYTFAPEVFPFIFTSRTVNHPTADQVVNFTGTLLTFNISGRIADNLGRGGAGETVTLGGSSSQTTQTDASGNYVFRNLPAGGFYSIVLPPSDIFSYPNPIFAVGYLGSDRVYNPVAVRRSYSLSGQVRNESGGGLAGVTISLGGGQSGSVITIGNGDFNIFNLPAGFNYTLTPSASNLSFTPQSTSVYLNSAKAGLNFTATSPQAGGVRFGAANYQFGEGAGRASVTVTRAGDISNPATVEYQTTDSDTFTVGCFDQANNHGGAYARCDFATTVGLISFAAGEASKTITVPLIDDGYAESAETFGLRLSNAIGTTLGTPDTTTVTIQDNDAVGAQNPVTTSFPFFVQQQYLDFLSREADPGGLNAWLGVLNNCANAFTGPNVPSQCDRIYVSGEGFFRSQEFQLKGFYVFRFYKVAFNRLPEYLEVVSDMSFVAGQTAEEVYARKAQVASSFTGRAEFRTLYGGLTNAQYVDVLLGRYGLTQVVTPDPAQPDGSQKVTLTSADLTNRLNNGTLSRAQVLRAVADSDAVGAREFNNAFVGMQYYGYLRRKPDPGGFDAWLRVLQSGDVRTMVNGFVNSTEYKLRFGQP